MLVSFLVPVFNVEKYLEECVESLLIQSGCNYEIILLDDGSTDKSGQLCDQYREKYPDIIRVIHKTNEGLLATRRRGFKEAKGDWFICVDSDDYIEPNLLETVVATIEKYNCDMVMYNYEYLDEEGKREKSKVNLQHEIIYTGSNKEEIYRKKLAGTELNSMCMRAIKRELVDIDTDYSNYGIKNMCEDAIQMLSIYTNAQKIVYLDSPLYVYRKGPNSITANVTLDSWHSIYRCACVTEKYLDLWNVSKEVREKYYTRYMEKACDYLRWLFAQNELNLEKTAYEMVSNLKSTDFYKTCEERYNYNYLSSKYLKLIVPISIYYLKKSDINGLKKMFFLEKKLNGLRKKS